MEAYDALLSSRTDAAVVKFPEVPRELLARIIRLAMFCAGRSFQSSGSNSRGAALDELNLLRSELMRLRYQRRRDRSDQGHWQGAAPDTSAEVGSAAAHRSRLGQHIILGLSAAGAVVLALAVGLGILRLNSPLPYLWILVLVAGFLTVWTYRKAEAWGVQPEDRYLRWPPPWEFLIRPFISLALIGVIVLLLLGTVSYIQFFLALWLLFVPVLLYITWKMFDGATTVAYTRTDVPPDELTAQLTFMMITRNSPPYVQEGVDSIHASCRAVGYTNYRVLVVTDVEAHFEGATMVIVPADYKCDALYKGRALNYALRFLPNSAEAWTFHCDEDAQLRPHTVAGLLHYIATEGKTKPVAHGFQSATYNRSLWGYFAEADRGWTMLWHRNQAKKIPLWANGGNILIRSDIEQEITWALGVHVNFFCEDTVFLYKVAEKKGAVFGWHGGTTIERAPSNLRALVKQRRRWFYSGILVIHLAPKGTRLLRAYAVGTWGLAFVMVSTFFAAGFSYMFGVPAWPTLPLWLDVTIAAFTAFWFFRTQLGLYLITRYHDPKPGLGYRLSMHLTILVLTPLVSLFSVLGPFLSLYFPPKGFEITEK